MDSHLSLVHLIAITGVFMLVVCALKHFISSFPTTQKTLFFSSRHVKLNSALNFSISTSKIHLQILVPTLQYSNPKFMIKIGMFQSEADSSSRAPTRAKQRPRFIVGWPS
jgi:hypothetical protein